ncbi:MAG: response regulator [Planctomycetota bacterium]|jgi:signal transduction histidine kinase|nr:response regulator [Planctomycetota bacterium]
MINDVERMIEEAWHGKTKARRIFTRLLLSNTLPFVIIFAVVMLIVVNHIYSSSASRVEREVMSLSSRLGERVNRTLNSLSGMVGLAAGRMAETVGDSERARRSAVEQLFALMDANADVYNAWFAFEPGRMLPRARYAKTFNKLPGGGYVEIDDVRDEVLANPAASPWYNVPLKSGEPYLDVIDHYDFGQGDGPEYIGTIAHPIKVAGTPVGGIGIDILYKRFFKFADAWRLDLNPEIAIIAEDGGILYSRRDHDEKTGFFQAYPLSEADAGDLRQAMRDHAQFMRTIRSPTSGTRSLIHCSPVPLSSNDEDFFLFVKVANADLYREANASVRLIVWVSLIGMAFLVAGVYAATARIVTPLKKLTDDANLAAKGRLDVRFDDLPPESGVPVEVITLQESLKAMLDKINQGHALRVAALQTEFEKREIEAAAAEKSRFFANMSHEIRTPMNAILGMAEILLEENLAPRPKRFAVDIKHSAESLLSIINDVLDLSRIESGKMELVKVHYDPRCLAENVGSVCGYLAREKNLDFDVDVAPDVPPALYGDEVRLRQILLNLVGNAVKFTAKGKVGLKIFLGGDQVRFAVSDTGIGIREKDRGALFNAFTQVDRAKTRKTMGTGLGLSISGSLAELMGGGIDVESVYGEGATFILHVPLEPGNPSLARSESTRYRTRRIDTRAKILVVDDNRLNLTVAKGLLGLYKVECDLAQSGKEALEKIAAGEYDLVFMDHMMPEMDGVETTRRIRKMGGRQADLPIIALTANAVQGARELLLTSGMNDFLSKPIERDKLHAVLERWIPAHRRRNTVVSRLPDSLTERLERAAAIEGLDIRQGLENADATQKEYEDALAKMAHRLPRATEAIVGLFHARDHDRLVSALSAERTAFANLGAVILSRVAAELEEAIGRGDAGFFADILPKFLAIAEVTAERLAEIFPTQA